MVCRCVTSCVTRMVPVGVDESAPTKIAAEKVKMLVRPQSAPGSAKAPPPKHSAEEEATRLRQRANAYAVAKARIFGSDAVELSLIHI